MPEANLPNPRHWAAYAALVGTILRAEYVAEKQIAPLFCQMPLWWIGLERDLDFDVLRIGRICT